MIVDCNGLQLDGTTDEIMSLGSLADKMRAFGFAVEEIDGHNFDEILRALDVKVEGKPLCIIAKTVKGKGVSFMENNVAWHGNVPTGDLMAQAKAELGGQR
jgi:transketolase